jgi:hypothetical protein
MSNELITIEESTALVAFSQDGGLNPFIEQVRSEVLNFEHDLSNDARRKKTASLAAKVRKVKTRLDKLGKSLTDGWAEKKKAVDKNRKSMRDEMDEIAELARKPLDEWEAEQEEIEKYNALLAMLEDAHKINAEFDEWTKQEMLMKHMDAINDNHEFNRVKAEAETLAAYNAEQDEIERIARDKAIAERAAEDARIKAESIAKETADLLEREKQQAIDDAKNAKREAEAQRQAAIQSELDAEDAREQAEAAAKLAEQRRIEQQNEAAKQAEIEKANRIAAEKEAKLLADRQAIQAAEQARINEVNRQNAEQQRITDENATRLANQEYMKGILTASKESLMQHAGLTEEQAVKVVKAIRSNKIANVRIKF